MMHKDEKDKVRRWVLVINVWLFAILVIYPEFWIRLVGQIPCAILFLSIVVRVYYYAAKQRGEYQHNWYNYVKKRQDRLRKLRCDGPS